VRARFEASGHPHDSRTGITQRSSDRRADTARGAGDKGHLPVERAHSIVRLCARRRNSSRVLESSRKMPRTALVTAREFCFSTPRIIMQK